MGAALAVVLAGSPAVASAAPVSAAPAPAAPETLCTLTDDRLSELSGLVRAPDGGVWAVDDGGRRVEVHRLDTADCTITDTRTADVDPYDAEDLALGPDGELWVSDTGDNEVRRETVAVIVLPADGDARLHRLVYPDGPHDAEALLVDAAGIPHVITKDVGGPGVYRTAAPPDGEGPTPLERVGSVRLPASTTEGGPVGSFGSRLVTGAAAAVDGRVVAVRTYTDAWLFPVPDGDLAAALTGTDPVQVPLPGEPQGEAIAFTPDGSLLSASETRGVPGELRVVPGAVALAGAEPAPAAPAPAAPEEPAPTWLPGAIGAGAVVLVLGLLAGALSIRARR